MRRLAFTTFFVVVVAGAATVLTEPDMSSDVPVIYWLTDPNPARVRQVEDFHTWLVENGHSTPDGRPRVELRLETISGAAKYSKGIIHGVSGVAADGIDCHVPWFHSVGMLADVTEDAERMGFGIDHTYAALEPLLSVNGRQYAFPCNVNVMGLWVNVDRYKHQALDNVMADLATPEVAAAEAARRITEEIQRTLRESPSLCVRYEKEVLLQAHVDSHRKQGRAIPMEWIHNPFHRKYYASEERAS
ncbi:MAG: hypothetical protein VX733_15515 [Candidatus Latescibacterota bacterium]|nr:hypothetical protein [Candidatus Latescibacterota bacterium]